MAGLQDHAQIANVWQTRSTLQCNRYRTVTITKKSTGKFILCPEFWNSFTMIKCNLCVRHFHERKTFNIQHSGGSRGGTRGGPPPAPIFRPNWGPKGQKTFFLETAPPFLRIWMTAPPPLSQGLDPVIQHHSPGPDPYKLTMWEIGRLRNICRERNRWCLKPGFHMSGKSQTIRGFTFCRPSQIWPIYRIIAQILPILNLKGNGKCAKNWNLYTNVW